MSSLGVRVTFSSLLWSCLSTLWEDWRPEKRGKILWIFALNKSMTYFGILRNLAYLSHARGGRSVYFTPCMCVCFCECVYHRSGPKRALRIYTHWPVEAVELEFRSDTECVLTTDLRPSLLLMLNDFDQDSDFALILGQCIGMTHSLPWTSKCVKTLTVSSLHSVW